MTQAFIFGVHDATTYACTLRAGEQHLWLVDNLLTVAIVTACAVAAAFIGYMLHRRKHL